MTWETSIWKLWAGGGVIHLKLNSSEVEDSSEAFLAVLQEEDSPISQWEFKNSDDDWFQ